MIPRRKQRKVTFNAETEVNLRRSPRNKETKSNTSLKAKAKFKRALSDVYGDDEVEDGEIDESDDGWSDGDKSKQDDDQSVASDDDDDNDEDNFLFADDTCPCYIALECPVVIDILLPDLEKPLLHILVRFLQFVLCALKFLSQLKFI